MITMNESALTSSSPTIAIIGSGYSGTLTAVNILRADPPPGLRVLLIDRERPTGRGLAYRTQDDSQLLNVAAGFMSALDDDRDHFLAFCRRIDPSFNAASFVSRRIYGDYLEQTLSDAEVSSAARLVRIGAEALAVRRDGAGGRFTIELIDGRRLDADQVVLAFGHQPPRPPREDILGAAAANWVNNPWDIAALDRLDPERPVALLGMSHSAIDALFRLTSSRPDRKVYLVSRRGLLPRAHRPTPPPASAAVPPSFLAAPPTTARGLIRAVRQEIAVRAADGGNWRDVLNGMRFHIPRIWQGLPERERRRLVEHVTPYWEIHRHRLPPAINQRLRGLLRSGQVETLAARVTGFEGGGHEVELLLQPRQAGGLRRLRVGAVVNCTGPNYDITVSTVPLIAQLRADGLIREDALHLGLDVADEYRVVSRDGTPVPGLHYVGPMLRAKYWEALEVTELRGHARALAASLVAKAGTTAAASDRRREDHASDPMVI